MGFSNEKSPSNLLTAFRVFAMSRLSSIEELEKTGPAVGGWGWDLGGCVLKLPEKLESFFGK